MIITISGKPGAGKSTVAKLAARKLKMKHYSAGELWRKIARRKKITILQLNRLAEKNPNYDKKLDAEVAKLGTTQDNFVIDGRLAFYFIPNSVKIFLDGSLEVRAKRILKDNRKEEDNLTIADTIEKIKNREGSERKRYKKLYGIDMYHSEHFDLVIPTSKASISQVTNKVVSFIKNRNI
ncbi:cytidylate kinase family protein [Candidatus Woesearchaeota archaeon]|nr:cytidylate kinase family protein [Candidatus Woesearchaeota archaeon]